MGQVGKVSEGSQGSEVRTSAASSLSIRAMLYEFCIAPSLLTTHYTLLS